MRQFYFSTERRFNTWLCSLVFALLSTVAIGQRVTHNLVSLYDFQEGSGSVVNDVSGNSPINLNIQHPGNVSWLPEGGLRINTGTIIRSTGAATRMHTALSTSGEFSFEAWIKPTSASQAGPARIATMSSNTSNRNFMLGQDGSNYVFRSRTNGGGDNNGMPQVSTSPAVVNLQHYVYTWKNGTEKIYLNGQLKHTGTRGGALTNWSSSFAFALGNEISLDRAWLGDFHLVAVYCQELDQNEVNTNFNEGPGIDYGTPVLEETCTLTGYESPTGRNFWLPVYATDFAPTGPGVVFEKYTNGTARIYGRVRSLSATSKEFDVDLWFNYKKNYQQWIASGGDIKEPQLGNVNFWTFYDFDEKRINMLTGQNSLAGQRIFVYKMPTNSYGLQIGDGANALNSNANGMSAWFNFFGSQNDHGDINATYNCAPICTANLTNVVFYNINNGATTPLVNGGTYTASSLGNNWNIEALTNSSAQSVRFTFSGNNTSTNVENAVPYRTPGDHVGLNLSAGTYSLNVKVYTEDNAGGILCDEETFSFTITGCDNATNGGQIGYSQSGCIGFDPAAFQSLSPPSGGSGALQIIWIRKSASTNWAYVEIPGATGLTYDSGPLTETTVFRRCARREFCSAYLAESNELTVTVEGACCSNITHPGEIAANQSGCAPFDPAPFTSVSLPTGGSGAIEYVWIYKNASTNWNWVNLPNSNSPTYDLPALNETTEIRRCSRRAGCVDFIGESNILTITVTGNCVPEEICLLNGYESVNGRILWIPAYGTDFRSSASNPLKLEKYSNGRARIVGTVERASNTNHKFNVSLWLDTKSNFSQWQAMGLTAHSPELGDESLWTYYKWSTTLPNTLIGTGSLAGVTLNLSNMDPVYGWQLGNGANALNTNANGISSWFVYTGTTSGNGDVNASYDCPSNCNLNVNAGPDQEICGPVTLTLTSTTTGASNCVIPGVTDCNHTLVAQGGYVQDAANVAACGNLLGAKLWTAGNQGTSFVVLDFGTVVPAGTQICANMKLEHCSQSNTSWSNVKIEASLNQSNSYFDVNSSIIFSNNNYQEFCYTLAQPARYVKVVDNGACSIRLDYVKYITPNGGSNAVTYVWNGPGIVGSNTTANINVNQPGTYTVTVTDCNGCSDSDTVVVTNDDEDPIFTSGQQTNYQLACGASVPLIQPTATDNNGAVTYTYVDNNVCVYPSDVCECTQVRVWTATDLCGNTATFTQNFTFGDNVNPVLVGVPSNYTAQCGTAPSVPTVTATDNCDNDVTVTFSEQIISASCPIQMIRTWTATDNCGNTVSASQTIFVDDTTNPVLVSVPANATVQCSAIPAPAPVTATDNCSNNLVVQFNQTIGTGCPYTITRTWSVTDNCGNTATATQVLQVVDTQIPTFIGVPADATMECTQPIMDAVVAAIDNCTPVADLVVSMSGETVDVPCGHLFIRTWTVTDNCGNVASASQTITVVDTANPVITSSPAAQLDLECDQIIPVGEVAFDDTCDEDLDIDFTEVVSNESACGRDITRTWIATDDCGNSVSFVQVIRIRDTTDPLLANVPSNTTVSCDQIPAPANVVASDNCSNPTLEFTEVQSQGCPYTITRTWSATDACGNTTVASQVIEVVDTVDPVLVNVPADVQAQCGSAPAVPVVTATDNCDTNVEVVFSEQVISASCPINIVRTWTAIDNCGNEKSASQTIYIDDTINPVLVGVPANVQAQCGSAPAVADVTATDNCDTAIEVMFSEQVISASCPINIVRTWTATDNCGNSTSASQTIYIDDTINPVLVDVPANTTVECDAIPAPASVSATDNCDATIQVMFSEVATTGCPYTITRTWSATDACGNTTVASQVIEVVDTVDPVLVNVPADVQAQCGSAPAVPVVTATDNCDTNVEVVFSEQVISASCPINIVRTWTAIDNCGNEKSASQTIYIDDTINPVLVNVPSNATVECDAIPTPAVVTATDNCDTNVEVSFNEVVTSGVCTYYIYRTWTAADNCGNSVSAEQMLTVVDTTLPELVGVPTNVTVECDNVPAAALVTATDNCDEELEVIFNESTEMLECGYRLTRTWSVSDDCNNTTSATQIVTVEDTTAPVISGEDSQLTLECNVLPSIVPPTVEDNCDENVELVFGSSIIPGSCENSRTEIYTWTATDNCGNTSVRTFTFYFQDTTDPTFDFTPGNLSVSCDAIPTAAVLTASDNCDNDVQVTFTETPGSGCEYQIVRTWTAVDNCGNSTSYTQYIAVADTTNPVINGVPADATVACDAIPAVATTVTAEDNCSGVELGFTEEVVPGAPVVGSFPCGSTIYRRWTAIDDCGNLTQATQVLTVIDTVAPELVGVPADLTVECGSVPAPAQVSATDNCNVFSMQVIFSELTVPVNACTYQLVRTWSVQDNCGNMASEEQLITVVDTTVPVLSNVPSSGTVACDAVPAPAVVTAQDICDGSLDVVFSEVETEGCPYTITRRWVATDACGNETEALQVLTVIDEENPTLIGVPADNTLECTQSIADAIVYAIDNCDNDMVVSLTSQTVQQDCGFQIIRTWSVADDCGNVTEATQVTTFVDTQAPIIVDAPAEEVVYECDETVLPLIVEFADSCDNVLTITQVSGIDNQDECSYDIIRSITATDDCGNSTTFNQVVRVRDTTAPEFTFVPEGGIVSCDAIPAIVMAEAEDNCVDVDDVTVTVQELISEGCPYTITRIYTATDLCGNANTASQVLIVNDTANPTLIGVPANIQAQCGSLPAVPTVTGSDNCDTDVSVEYSQQVLSAACPIQVIRTWTATDNCGNQTSASQTIYINDTTNPVLVNVPANATVECDAVPAPANVTATDNCSTNLVVNFEENQIDADCGYTLVRTWSVEDACGNEAVRTQMITVVDTTSPVLSGADEELTFECNMMPMVIAPTAIDNCDENVDVVFNSQTIPGSCENNYSIVYTWTATDDCGNQDVRTIVHNFEDTTKPTFNGVPANLTVPCDAIPAAAEVSAQDNCDMDVVVTLNEAVGTGCPYTITRTWTATDNCGNQEVATQTLTVVDTVDPYFTSVSEDQTIECTEEVPAGSAQAADNCDMNVDVTMVEVVEEFTCETVITRTWTATDNCGNTVTAQQVITVVDTVDPIIESAPSAEVTILCTEAEPTDAPVFSDACDNDLQIIAISGIANVNDCGYDIQKVWTAIDDCGNSISFSRVIHVVDTIAPEFITVPANATVECSNIPAPAEVEAEDNCTAVSIEFAQEELAGNGCTYTIERVWTATDVCGNETTYTQVLTVVDTTHPTVESEPSDITVECGQAIPMVSPVFADNCDENISVEYSSEIVRQDACGYDEERTWVAVDNCGNETVVTQLVTVVDTTEPVLEGVPANVTAECSDVPAAAIVTATDNCDDLVNVVFSEEMQDADCGYTLVRRWSATDICGNVAEATQVVTVVDTTNPFITEEPADAVYACDQEIPYTAPVFGDLCDENLTVVPFETVTPNGCNQLITRRWVATDDCGNSIEAIQLISVVDTVAPVITGPPAMSASCTATAYDLNVVTEDNCDEDVTLTFVDLEFSGGCEGYIQRTWTATDDCGNASTLVQVIQRTDNEVPTIATQPQDLTVECDEVVPVFNSEFSDNCDDELTIAFTETEETLTCGYQITRVWEVTDNCDNTLVVDQIITVVDTTEPILVGVPTDVTVLCNQIPSVAVVTASDNCDEDVVVSFSQIVETAACGEVITRTWRAEDNCGNSSVATQVITVTDTIAPTLFNVPSNVQIVCGSPIPAPSTSVTATDNCTDDLVVSVMETEGMEGCERVIYRTYSVEDACGNEASATQRIRIIDNLAPTFDQFVSDMTVNCDQVPAAPVVTASDNCDDINVVFDEVVSTGCPYTIERTWTATDACGNESMLTQTITVVDNELPVFDPFPVFVQVQCDEVAAYTITASDNCDSDVEVVIEQELVFSGSCYGTLQRIYRATDNCGNTVTALQLVDIIDSEAPVFTSTVQNVTVTCDMPIPAIPAGMTAEDNCDNEVEITFNEVQTSQFCPFNLVRTWTAEDECGNQTQLVQTITVTVETAPIFHLTAYPNPTAGDVVIEFSSPKPGKLDAGLYDISGRKIETIYEGQAEGERLYKYSFNAREWNAGAYMIRVISEDAVHQQRLVVTGK